MVLNALLQIAFAVKPGLTDSRFCKDAKQYRLTLRCPGVKVTQGGCSSANRQVI